MLKVLILLGLLNSFIGHQITAEPEHLNTYELKKHKSKEKEEESESEEKEEEHIKFEKYLENLGKSSKNFDFKSLFKMETLVSIGTVLARLAIIFAIFSFLWNSSAGFSTKLLRSIMKRSHKNHNAELIEHTAAPIITSLFHWLLVAITSLIVLTELGIDIKPIILAFSVVGLAISFGAQSVVKDVILGILILLEGSVAVGEIVELNGVVASIEGMTLRAIELRHMNGTLQVVSFSEVETLCNLSRDFVQCNVIVPVNLDSDYKKVEQLLIEVFNELKQSEKWRKEILDDIEVTGVTEITETAVYIKCQMNTKPDPEDYFGQAFRKLLYIKLREHKIVSSEFANFILKKSI